MHLGIGLEVHEEPYLRGGSNSVIKSSHTFSNEPGIYIEGEVGLLGACTPHGRLIHIRLE